MLAKNDLAGHREVQSLVYQFHYHAACDFFNVREF